ncbi:TAXI family TRAP transporter solute-binding subunit [Hoeflea sp.]|uniref:TAXI family TRAP transporter solute-binding subunit n=1 Tax=Hoeflea sp. TaxID=1940281 RepID=UPI003A947CC0
MRITKFANVALVAASLAVFGAGTASAADADWKKSLVFGGGSLGGVYYTVAGAISDLVQQKVEGIDRVSTITGSTTLFIPQIQENKVDIMLGTPDSMYFGWSAEAGLGFDKDERYDKLRVAGVAYINIMDLVVLKESGFGKIEDIADGRVGVLSATLKVPMELYLKAHGIEDPQVTIIGDWNQMAQALRDGSIAAMQGISTHPTPAITELGNAVDLQLLSYSSDAAVKDFLSNPTTRFFQKAVQPAGTYDWQTEDYATIGRGTTVIVSADLPDDEVYAIVKTIYENTDALKKVHPSAADFTTAMVQEYLDAGVIQIPFHPGARRYFEEQGVKIPDSVPAAE